MTRTWNLNRLLSLEGYHLHMLSIPQWAQVLRSTVRLVNRLPRRSIALKRLLDEWIVSVSVTHLYLQIPAYLFSQSPNCSSRSHLTLQLLVLELSVRF